MALALHACIQTCEPNLGLTPSLGAPRARTRRRWMRSCAWRCTTRCCGGTRRWRRRCWPQAARRCCLPETCWAARPCTWPPCRARCRTRWAPASGVNGHGLDCPVQLAAMQSRFTPSRASVCNAVEALHVHECMPVPLAAMQGQVLIQVRLLVPHLHYPPPGRHGEQVPLRMCACTAVNALCQPFSQHTCSMPSQFPTCNALCPATLHKWRARMCVSEAATPHVCMCVGLRLTAMQPTKSWEPLPLFQGQGAEMEP